MPIYVTDLVEMSVKSGGHVYLSRGTNAPLVSDELRIRNANKRLLIVACRLWHNVSTDIRYFIASSLPRHFHPNQGAS